QVASLYHALYPDRRRLHSFPTRRSSDLIPDCTPATKACPRDYDAISRRRKRQPGEASRIAGRRDSRGLPNRETAVRSPDRWRRTDRKSTRLNSSHLVTSYAVFCLKKKNR